MMSRKGGESGSNIPEIEPERISRFGSGAGIQFFEFVVFDSIEDRAFRGMGLATGAEQPSNSSVVIRRPSSPLEATRICRE